MHFKIPDGCLYILFDDFFAESNPTRTDRYLLGRLIFLGYLTINQQTIDYRAQEQFDPPREQFHTTRKHH